MSRFNCWNISSFSLWFIVGSHLFLFGLGPEEENVDVEENVSGTPNGKFGDAEFLRNMQANVGELGRTLKRRTSNSSNIHCFVFCRLFFS